MKSIAMISLLAFLGSLAILVLSIHFWWDPILPVIIGLTTLAIPFVVAVVFAEKLVETPDLHVLGTAAFVALFFGGALPGLWTDARFRAAIVPFLDGDAFSKLQDDPASEVHLTACNRMFELELPEAEIVQFIQDRPADAMVCITRPNAGTVPLTLSRVWQFQLRDGGACEIAETIAEMTMISAENRTIELLDCALTSRSSEARQCCATAMKSLQQDENIPFWIMRHHADLQKRQALAPLVLLSQEDPNTIMRYDAATITDVGITAPVIQGAALNAACQATMSGLDNEVLERALRWSMATQSGCFDAALTVSPPAEDLCQIYLNTQPSVDAFCAANGQARLERVQRMEEAKRHKGRSEELGNLADAIVEGHHESSLEDFMESKTAQPGARPVHTFSPADEARFRLQMENNQPNTNTRFHEMMKSNDANLKQLQGKSNIW